MRVRTASASASAACPVTRVLDRSGACAILPLFLMLDKQIEDEG